MSRADVSEHSRNDGFDDEDDEDAWIPINTSESTQVNSEDLYLNDSSEATNKPTEDTVWSESVRSSLGAEVPTRTSSDRSSETRSEAAFGAETDTSRSSSDRKFSQNNIPSNQREHTSQRAESGNRRDEGRESLSSIRRRLETRATVRRNLIDHPLDQMAGVFLRHFARELWNQDFNVHLGVSLLVIGLVLQAISIANLITFALPRAIFLLAIFFLSHIYLFRVDQRLAQFFQSLSSGQLISEKILQWLERLDAHKLRQLLLFLLISITLLEMKAIIFLSGIVIEAGWFVCILASVGISAALFYCKEIQRISCSECYAVGIICLYVFAFLASVVHAQDMRRIAALGGPFLLAAGAFVLASHTNHQGNDIGWLIRPVRHSIRLSLRDILANIGENVAEDEMLQLAMLRWLVDYWTFRPERSHRTDEYQQQSNDSSNSSAFSTPQQSNFSSSVSSEQGSNSTQNTVEAQTIGWGEMHSMLTMTTDQMMGEVQQPTQPQQASTPESEGASSNYHNPSSTNSFDHSNGSIGNLKSMLASLSVDTRAKNAVNSYRQTVENLPPSRNSAITVALVRRCPSFLCLSSWYLDGSWDALPATFILLPFIVLEVIRIRDWIKSCQDAFETQSTTEVIEGSDALERDNILQLPSAMDPMCILFSSDNYCRFRPSPAIQVWINVQSSVVALESGLTAVRCVQTTVVASELAFNVMSLAQLGAEVYNKGWAHGIGILARDIFHFHNRAPNNSPNNAHSGQYTNAAFNAVKNGQIIARNVSDLMEDEHGRQVVGVIGDMLAIVVGRGWLWRDEPNEHSNTSRTTDERSQSGDSEENMEPVNHMDPQKENSKAVNAPDSKSPEACPMPNNTSDDETSTFATSSPHEKSEDKEETNTAGKLSISSDSDDSGHTESQHDENHTIGEVSNEVDSDLFDLMAEALDQGLISESEKDAFVEMLLKSSNKTVKNEKGSEESHTPTKAEVVDMIQKSLECLFSDVRDRGSGNDEGTNVETKMKNEPSVGQGVVEQSFTPKIHQDTKNNVFSPTLPDVTQDEVRSSDRGGNVCDLEYESLEHQDDTKHPPSTIISSCSSSQGSSTNGVARAGGPSPCTSVNFDDEEDDEQWTHIRSETIQEGDTDDPNSGSSESMVKSRELSMGEDALCVSDKASASCTGDGADSEEHLSRRENNNGDEWMKWVGGGLAVIGAVVGSVALVNGCNENHEKNKGPDNRAEQQQQRSTVYIEELSDGDEND